ncbi:MAG TPA: hypothetical protein VIF62_33240, partial [Labilithrix sp.]
MKRILLLLRPGPGISGVIACLLVWVPLVTGALELAFDGPRDFGRSWAIGIAIGDTCCVLSFLASLAVREVLAAIARWRGKPPATHGASFYFAIVAIAMPAVLPCAMLAGTHVASCVGRSYHSSLGHYRIALVFGAITVALLFLQRTRSDARD